MAKNFEVLQVINTFRLSEEVILFIFVPPLIFESALNMDSRLLLRNLAPVLTLAAPGLLISTAIVGIILAWLTPLSLPQALLFGSLISATDPVAVIALFKELGVPKQLAILVEGESLFNDATAIVTFNIIFGTIAAGAVGADAIQKGASNFLVSFTGGILAGAVFGYLMRLAMNLAKNDTLIVSTITTITAYGAFLIADEVLHVSPVMSVVSAGLVVGWYKSNRLEPEVRKYVSEFWEYSAFLANSLIFLLVGITASSFRFFEQLSQTQSLLTTLGITIVTVLVARAVVVFTLIPIVNLFREFKISFSYQLVSYWGGLRGAVCLALALSIEPDFPNRDLIIILTLGIALFTLLIPGTTVGNLIKNLQLNRPSILNRLGQAIAVYLVKKEALEESNLLKNDNYFFSNVVEDFTQIYQQEVNQAKQDLINLQTELDLNEAETQQLIWSEAIAIEQQVYNELQDRGFISQPVLSQLTFMINLKSDAVKVGNIPPEFKNAQPFEIRLNNLLIELLNGSSWVEKIQSNLTTTNYEYLTFYAYACEEVISRLKNFAADSGIPETAIEDCIHHYQKNKQELISLAEATVQNSPELAIAFQTRILNRVVMVTQKEAVEGLAEKGVISETVVTQIHQLIDTQ